MPKDPKDARELAENQFKKAQKTKEPASGTEQEARRRQISRLKAQRLAKETAEHEAEPAKKPRKGKAGSKRKKGRQG